MFSYDSSPTFLRNGYVEKLRVDFSIFPVFKFDILQNKP